MINDFNKLMFASIIAYGILFCALLFGAGFALSEPWTVQMAVVTAGAAYVTQLAGVSAYRPLAYVCWAVTCLPAGSGLIALFGG